MKKEIVISLGGSTIIQEDININFLKEFREIILKNKGEYQFIIVTGGGSIARKYIESLKGFKKSEYFQGLIGISITRMNARFISYLFEEDPNNGIPHSKKEVMEQIKNKNPVLCGGLEYKKEETSDSTAAKIASFLDCEFINLTNVAGLYTKDPNENPKAKLIKDISWEKFKEKTNELEYKPGQNFVLDQKAAEIIKENKIKTYIIGKKLKNLENILNHKDFEGTIIKG